MQVWPLAAKMPATTPLAAASRSASAKTMFGRLAAELQRHAREVLGGALHHGLAGRGPAGEGDLVDARVRDQRRARLVAVAGDDVEDARREARLLDQRGELERRGRRLLGGLDDDAAARGQRRRGLPAHQQHGRVPGRDRRHHADRLAQRVDEEVVAVGRQRLAADLVGRAREVVVVVGQPAQLALHLADQLAVVGRLHARDPRGVLLDQLGEPAQQPRARDRRRARPRRERATCGADRGVDVLGARARDRRPRLRRERVDALESGSRARVDPLAADEHPVRLHPVQP